MRTVLAKALIASVAVGLCSEAHAADWPTSAKKLKLDREFNVPRSSGSKEAALERAFTKARSRTYRVIAYDATKAENPRTSAYWRGELALPDIAKYGKLVRLPVEKADGIPEWWYRTSDDALSIVLTGQGNRPVGLYSVNAGGVNSLSLDVDGDRVLDAFALHDLRAGSVAIIEERMRGLKEAKDARDAMCGREGATQLGDAPPPASVPLTPPDPRATFDMCRSGGSRGGGAVPGGKPVRGRAPDPLGDTCRAVLEAGPVSPNLTSNDPISAVLIGLAGTLLQEVATLAVAGTAVTGIGAFIAASEAAKAEASPCELRGPGACAEVATSGGEQEAPPPSGESAPAGSQPAPAGGQPATAGSQPAPAGNQPAAANEQAQPSQVQESAPQAAPERRRRSTSTAREDRLNEPWFVNLQTRGPRWTSNQRPAPGETTQPGSPSYWQFQRCLARAKALGMELVEDPFKERCTKVQAGQPNPADRTSSEPVEGKAVVCSTTSYRRLHDATNLGSLVAAKPGGCGPLERPGPDGKCASRKSGQFYGIADIPALPCDDRVSDCGKAVGP